MPERTVRRTLLLPVILALVCVPLVGLAGGAGASAPAAAQPKDYQQTISRSIDDLEEFWADTFPSIYSKAYTPIPDERVFVGRPGVQFPTCQGQRLTYADVEENAFYCYRDNFVAYDDVKLFPKLYETYGAFSLGVVLAHEWGHGIQDRSANAGQKTVYKELQADCFAGAWVYHIANDKTPVAFKAGDLESGLAALLTLGDAPGVDSDDPDAHGSAFDRVAAFSDGYRNGVRKCSTYFSQPPVVVQIPFTSRAEFDSGGNAPAEDVIPLAVDLLNEFYQAVDPTRYRSLSIDDFVSFDSSKVKTIPKCGGTKLKKKQVQSRVFYCIDDGYIGFDEPYLQHVYDDIGDFGVVTLIANAWGTRVQILQGLKGATENSLDAVFQDDCYTGGFTAAFFNGSIGDGVSLSPGDLDEVVQALLDYSRSRGISSDVPITFARMQFINAGFYGGYRSCDIGSIQRQMTALSLR